MEIHNFSWENYGTSQFVMGKLWEITIVNGKTMEVHHLLWVKPLFLWPFPLVILTQPEGMLLTSVKIAAGHGPCSSRSQNFHFARHVVPCLHRAGLVSLGGSQTGKWLEVKQEDVKCGTPKRYVCWFINPITYSYL